MPKPNCLLSLFLSFCLILEQSVFAQTIDLSHYFARNSGQTIPQADKFRPLHLRYISYDSQANDFKLLLDKGDFFNQRTEKPKNEKTLELEKTSQELMKYFFIGLALPNDKFWVNLRPDSPDNILDPDLEKTDIGRIFLEADLQLKKDTSSITSPQTPEGRVYWDKLYKKAGELFGAENITIPTITRPWIVPDEVILRESPEGAYIYKATLKVMLEEDYLNQKTEKPKNPALPAGRQKTEIYNFSDPRLKELNEYSTQLIKESIIPRLTKEINSARRYAPLRQVYYSLILAQWFKQKYGSLGSARAPGTSAPVNNYIDLIDSGNLANITSSRPYDKQDYFKQYQKSFQGGEYNLHEPVYTPMGQSIRRYMSGGMRMDCSSAIDGGKILGAGSPVFGNLKQTIKKYAIYLSVSLPLVIFSAEPSIKAVTIKNHPDDNDPKIEAVVEREKSLEEIVRAVCRELFGDIKEEDVVKYIAIIEKQYSKKEVGRDEVIDVTKLAEENAVKEILTRSEVASEEIIEVEGQKHKIYFIRSGDKIKAFNSVNGATIGDAIFINLKLLWQDVEFVLENKEKKFMPPMISEDELYQDMLKATLIHELMHVVLSKWLQKGLKTRDLDIALMYWFGDVPPAEFFGMKQELIAHLVQTLSSSFPKSYLLDFMASSIDEAQPLHYRNIFAVIISEVFMAETTDDLENGLRNLSNDEIKKRVKIILKKYYGKDVLLTVAMLQEEVKELLSGERIPRKPEQGNSVKLRINPALLSKINNPKLQQENSELKAKTVAEVLEKLGLKKAFDEGKIVVRLERANGSSKSFYKNLPLEKQRLLDGDTTYINPAKGGGSSPVSASSIIPEDEKSTSSALELGWVDNKIPEDEKRKIKEMLSRYGMLRGFKGKVWIQFGSMERANLIEEKGYFPLELKKQAKDGDGSITIPVSFPLFAEKRKEAILWYLAAVLAYGAAESYGDRFAWSVLEESGIEMISDAVEADLQLEEYDWGMDGGDWTMKKWNLIDWIATPLILMKMIKDDYGEQVEEYLRYLESAGKIYVTNNEAIEDEMSRKRGNFLLFVKDYVISVLPFKLTNNWERAGVYLKRIEEIYGLSEEVCIPGNIKDLINNNSYPDDFALGEVTKGINENLASYLGIAGSPVVSEINPLQSNNTKGGIDLSRINKSMRAESVASPGAGGGSSPVDVDFDVNEELGRLQNMLNAEIIPSASRLDRYARAARASFASSPESADSAISLVAEAFRLQENKAVPAAPELKALAAWLEQAG